MALRDRCKEFYQRMQRDAMLRQGSPVDDLTSFVETEIGRSADGSLENTHSLVLYFGNEEDREEMMAAIREAKPGMMAKRFP